MKGRKIADNLILAQEFTMGFKDKSFSARAMISIDFGKAFDCLRWDGIEVIMEKLGFGTMTRKLMKAYISSTSFLDP